MRVSNTRYVLDGGIGRGRGIKENDVRIEVV